MGAIIENISLWQWGLVLTSSLLLFFFSPLAKTNQEFYKATSKGRSPNWMMLTGSLVISWVFAKSITNAADLGNEFGFVGGLAYASYYLSFIVVGIVIYFLRKKGGFNSLHHFLKSRFGRGAIIAFSVVIAFRLFNEVWSNTMVIGSYFGEFGSQAYYWSIIVFTILTLAYSLKGGLRSAIFSDAVQMILFAILLSVILYILMGNTDTTVVEIINTGEYSWETGLNLLVAGLLQSLSYGFHDPVMTDRGFISPIKTTIRSFVLAGFIGGVCILLFSFLGVFGSVNGFGSGSLTQTAKLFGPILLLLINFIMIVSAASTLDSSFSSFSKLAAVDLNLGNTLKFGRITMVIVAVAGTIPIFFNPTILSATTISGTMVIGLTPVFIFWWIKVPRISFYLSLFAGVIVGVLLAFDCVPSQILFTHGAHHKLLWMNVFGILICVALYFTPLLFLFFIKKK